MSQKNTGENNIAVIGIGKMGGQIVRMLEAQKFNVVGWNSKVNIVDEVEKNKSLTIFWLMVPHEAVEDVLFGKVNLASHLKPGDIVIDGGNSHYTDSMRRGKLLEEKGIHFFDAGISGGIWGEKNGFTCMVGGPNEAWAAVEPLFKTLSPQGAYALLGKNGAGHFAKMVHNGVEYGMMEAIAEGYGLLDASDFSYDLKEVTKLYQSSVIKSWLVDLCKNIFENEDIKGTLGKIDATGEGEWSVDAGKKLGIDTPVIADSLRIRRESADAKNQQKFSNKIVALLRKQFGGHAVYRKE